LSAALRRAGVKQQFEKAVCALLQDHVVQVGDRVMARTPHGVMSLDEYVQRWALSEEGAPYRDLAAPRRVGHERVGPDTFAAAVKRLR
jgi:hypothetical protein